MGKIKQYNLSKEGMEWINDEFLESYDHEYWKRKLELNIFIEEHIDEFDLDNYKSLGDDVEAYKNTVRAEYVYMFYHSAEALFSLLKVHQEYEIPWIDMKNIGLPHITEFVDELKDGTISDEELMELFYVDIQSDNLARINEDVSHWLSDEDVLEESVDHIREYLIRIGDILSENQRYNEYKHGLRLITDFRAVKLMLKDSELTHGESVEAMSSSGLAQIYLDMSDDPLMSSENKAVYQTNLVIDFFNPELYKRLCEINYVLIKQMFLAMNWYREKASDDGDPDEFAVSVFNEDLVGVFDEFRDGGKCMIPIPQGEFRYEPRVNIMRCRRQRALIDHDLRISSWEFRSLARLLARPIQSTMQFPPGFRVSVLTVLRVVSDLLGPRSVVSPPRPGGRRAV